MHIRSAGLTVLVAMLLLGASGVAAAETADELLEQLRILREEVEKRRTELRGDLEALEKVLRSEGVTAEGESASSAVQQELRELAELQAEVAARRAQLNRELVALKEALGPEVAVRAPAASAGAMTREELEAELRILREEWELVKSGSTSLGDDAYAAVKVFGQIRTRFEWNEDDFTKGAADLNHLLRSRLGVRTTAARRTRVFIQVQDARAFGEETGTLTDGSADRLDFHQAYVEVEKLFSKPVDMQLGRQELVLGGERLVGSVGWHNNGRAFDAIRFRYAGKSHRVDVFNAKLAENGARDRNLYGIYGHLKSAAKVVWEPYALLEHDKGDARVRRATAGLHGDGEFKAASGHKFGYEFEGAYQAGDLGEQSVAAWMATAAVRYQSSHWREHKVVLGGDILSGDDDPASGDYKAFDTLFATNHKFYGQMDFFLNVPENTNQQGLVDVMLKAEMKVAKRARMRLHLHNFSLLEGAVKKLGQEVDAVVDYNYNKAYSLQMGALFFLPGEGMKRMKSGDDPAYKTYLQTVLNF